MRGGRRPGAGRKRTPVCELCKIARTKRRAFKGAWTPGKTCFAVTDPEANAVTDPEANAVTDPEANA